MNQQTKNRYGAVTQQINSVRKIYSDIGQPLPAEIIIDLHQYLGKAMDIARETPLPKQRGTKSNMKN